MKKKSGEQFASGTCKVCGKKIEIAIFKGGAWCSENCRKIYVGEIQAGLRP